jgi:acetyltransferase-like isoleucine patch superfamily enzyme
MEKIRYIFRLVWGGQKRLYTYYSWIITVLKLWLNGVRFDRSIKAYGIPVVNVGRNATFIIGKNFAFKSGKTFTEIGRPQPTYFTVRYNGVLTIGNNVGVNNVAIVCEKKITIGDNVRIGANVVIYDSDFHSLDVTKRAAAQEDRSCIKRKPITIEEGAFIGSHVTILKGVTIGKNSVIGAAAVVTRNVPPDEIWAGNPAVFIKFLPTTEKRTMHEDEQFSI